MGALSDDLSDMGYEPTGEESPFDDDGRLWSNGVELVCDETGAVIRGGDTAVNGGDSKRDEREYFRYPNSGKIRMVGGFVSTYFDDDAYWSESK